MFRAIGKLLHWIWGGLDGLRKVLHLVLLLVLFGTLWGALSRSIPLVPDKAALVIAPQGPLVEQLSGDPLERAVAEILRQEPSETLLRDVVEAIDTARDDARISALYLDLCGMESLLRLLLRTTQIGQLLRSGRHGLFGFLLYVARLVLDLLESHDLGGQLVDLALALDHAVGLRIRRIERQPVRRREVAGTIDTACAARQQRGVVIDRLYVPKPVVEHRGPARIVATHLAAQAAGGGGPAGALAQGQRHGCRRR